MHAKNLPRLEHKLSTVENTLALINTPIRLREFNDQAQGLLFLGRLREDCGLELLIEMQQSLRSEGLPTLGVKIVGAGVLEAEYIEKYGALSCVTFCGEVYDEAEIYRHSLSCFAGGYPGDAGLSVAHYIALGLPAVIHDAFHKHMGVGPPYVAGAQCGVLFVRNDMREAASRLLTKSLWAAGAKVQVFDPEAMEETQRMFGSRDDLVLMGTKEAALNSVDCLVIFTEWQNFKAPDFYLIKQSLSEPLIVDGRNLFEVARGIVYWSMGW